MAYSVAVCGTRTPSSAFGILDGIWRPIEGDVRAYTNLIQSKEFTREQFIEAWEEKLYELENV